MGHLRACPHNHDLVSSIGRRPRTLSTLHAQEALAIVFVHLAFFFVDVLAVALFIVVSFTHFWLGAGRPLECLGNQDGRWSNIKKARGVCVIVDIGNRRIPLYPYMYDVVKNAGRMLCGGAAQSSGRGGDREAGVQTRLCDGSSLLDMACSRRMLRALVSTSCSYLLLNSSASRLPG